MKILAGSIEQAADTFLHAGYMSAYPRGVWDQSAPHFAANHTLKSDHSRGEHGEGEFELQVTLDMVSALRLEGEDVTATETVAPPRAGAASLAQAPAWTFQVTTAAFFFLAVGAYYVMRHRRRAGKGSRRSQAIVVGAIALAAVLVLVPLWRMPGVAPLLPPPSTAPPWEGVAVKPYADPEQATLAIMHGLVGDALSSVPVRVEALTQLQNEVAIPSAALTEGQRYALTTYGLDGWGNPLRLSSASVRDLVASGDGQFRWTRDRDKEVCYVLASAGADGRFDNGDDIVVEVEAATEYTWDVFRHAYYIQNDGGEPVLLYHRWAGKMFRPNDAERARRLTNTDMFDVIGPMNHREEIPRVLDAMYEEAAQGLAHEPLVLQVFEPVRHS